MDEQRTVKISISGRLNFEDSITLTQAAQIVAFIDSSSGFDSLAAAPAVPPPSAVPVSASRMPSIEAEPVQLRPLAGLTAAEALEKSGATTNPEKIVAFAALVLSDGQKETFTIDDIKPLFRRARHAVPANLSRDLSAAVRAGWVADADDKGEYYLTTKADAALEGSFKTDRGSRNSSPSRSKSTGSRKPRKTAEVPEAFKEMDTIPNMIDGVGGYHKMAQRKYQFLWVLKLAKDLGLDGLSNQEVVWLTDHLGAGIAANNINSAFTTAQRQGHVNKSTQTQKFASPPKAKST